MFGRRRGHAVRGGGLTRACFVLLLACAAPVSTALIAHADVPVGPARLVPCPAPTGDPARYQGDKAPYACHSAVVDPLNNTVILRQGRSDGAGPGAFGWLHASLDHNVGDDAIERVVSSAYPITAPNRRFRYIAEFRADGRDVIAVWVEVDRKPSGDAPDQQPFGVVTAYCKYPAKPDPENKCPDWVNDTL